MWSEGLRLKRSERQGAARESKKMYNALNMLMCCETRRLMLKRSNREESAEASFREFY